MRVHCVRISAELLCIFSWILIIGIFWIELAYIWYTCIEISADGYFMNISINVSKERSDSSALASLEGLKTYNNISEPIVPTSCQSHRSLRDLRIWSLENLNPRAGHGTVGFRTTYCQPTRLHEASAHAVATQPLRTLALGGLGSTRFSLVSVVLLSLFLLCFFLWQPIDIVVDSLVAVADSRSAPL